MIEENSNVELKKLKKNWSNYCYIDKQNVEFERPEEWALQYKNEIGLQEDGFRLAYLGEGNDDKKTGEDNGGKKTGEDNDALLLAINDRENGLTTKQKEEIFKEILNNFHLHKVTFLEAHKMLDLSNSTTETTSEIAETSSSQKQEETYKRIKFEMRKIGKIFKNQKENKKENEEVMEEIQNEEDEDEKALNVLNKQLINLKSVNSQFFQQFEGNIKIKTEWQKCLNYVLLLKIFVKNNLKIEKIKKIISEKLEKECKLNDKKVDKELKNLENNLNKLFKEFKKIISQIENKNQLMEYFGELKSIEKKSEEKGRRVEIIEKMDKLVVGENINEFDGRLKNKFKFLLENWKKLFFSTNVQNEEIENIFYKQILPESGEIKNYFKDSGPLFVKYCLTKRIENSFNKDGTVKFSDFLSNGVGQEYGWELNEVLGQKRIDIGHYENIQKQIKEKLETVCEENFEENFKNGCKLFLEHELQYWHSFCSIDTEHLRFERFEEMNVVTNGYQHKKGEEKKNSFKEVTPDEFGVVSKSEEKIEDAIKKTTSDEVKGDDTKSEGEIQVL